jgi:hypothetical protein
MTYTEDFSLILRSIEKRLAVQIVNVMPLNKIYDSKSGSFSIKTISKGNQSIEYFLKLGGRNNILNEIEGSQFLKKFLRTPKIILISKKNSSRSWILFENLHGNLMVERYLNFRAKNNMSSFYKLERKKEKILLTLFLQKKKVLDYKDYIKLKPNQLFYKRLLGGRYKEFYRDNKNGLSRYFNHQIILNGKPLPQTINEVFDRIRQKYLIQKNRKVIGIMGHGDAHHGNIMIDKNINFIDTEYADFATPFMELSKPYYNDFIGTLFFYMPRRLERCFQIKKFKDSENVLNFEINCTEQISDLIKIAQIKISERSQIVNPNSCDFISLNDYLVLCHTLTKNPNDYPTKTKLLFLIFTLIIASFNPFAPESIYSFF